MRHGTWDDAVALVPDGATVAFSGAILRGKPVAAAVALARAGRRDLGLVTFTGSLEVEVLLAAGALRSVTSSYVGLGVHGPARGFAAAVAAGAVEDRDLGALLPESKKRAYDVHPLVEGVLDDGTMQELHARWAPNIVTALGRFGGRTVGVVANNPLRLGGCLDSLSAEKASRFVRMCDAFGVPLVVVVDVPGYLPGVGQEWDGVVRRGAKLLHAFGECVRSGSAATRRSPSGTATTTSRESTRWCCRAASPTATTCAAARSPASRR